MPILARHCRNCGKQLPVQIGRGRPRLYCGERACPKPAKAGGWTEVMKDKLRQLYPTQSVESFAHLFGRSRAAVSSKAKILGLEKAVQRKVWTRSELAKLRRLYPDTKTVKLVEIFGCSERALFSMAKCHGIHKSAAYLASPDACRLRRGDDVGKPYRYPKGHVPANKGTRRPGYYAGRMRETWFKKGQRGNKFQPIGSIRLSKEGYKCRKVTATGYPPKDWVPVHRLLWIKHRGKIPKGHVVIFRNGDKTDIRMGNLKLITFADNMRRNTVHNLPPKLKEVIYLKAALTHRITTRKRHEEQDRGPEEPPVRDAGGAQGKRKPHAAGPGRDHRPRRAGHHQHRQGRGGVHKGHRRGKRNRLHSSRSASRG